MRIMKNAAPLNIAVIGVGSFGSIHARTLAALAEVRLAALGDRDARRAQTLAKELGVPCVFSTIEELIEHKTTDALVVATHVDTHVAIAKKAMAAGLHVLVEKPVGRNLDDVKSLEETSRHAEGRVIAMAGHICMFHSQVSPLIQRVRSEGFRSAHFVRHRSNTTLDDYAGYHPVNLTMVHDLYVAAQMACGEEPERFDCLDAADAKGRIDHGWATLRWKDGRVATFHSHWMLPEGAPALGLDRLEVFGQAYYTRVDATPQSTIWMEKKAVWPIGLEISSVDGRPTGILAEEQRSFAAACRTGNVPAGCRMQDAVQVQWWMDRLLESARANRKSAC